VGFALLLASASPRRRQLLALLGLPFRIVNAAVDENTSGGEPPDAAAARLALAKARAVSHLHPAALVLGCDTVVALEGDILGKPADAQQAAAMLARLRDRAHEVYTAIALLQDEQEAVHVAATTVRMRAYSETELAAYVASGDPLDKAGAYAIQHPTFRPVDRWTGCYANVMGLPLCHLAAALRAWSVNPPADIPAACQAHTGKRCAAFPAILGRVP